jgi:hypothetical protein
VYILFLSLTIAGCSQEPYSAAKPVSPSKSQPSSHEEKKKEINLPGSCSFSIPDAFSFRERDSNYIEFYNQDGIPSIFVTTYNIKDYSPGWIALLPDTVAAAIQFRVEQEELEEEKTRGLKEYGLNSEIIKWNTPYPLPHLKQPSFGIDYVRHDKSNVMGKHQEGRAYCILTLLMMPPPLPLRVQCAILHGRRFLYPIYASIRFHRPWNYKREYIER